MQAQGDLLAGKAAQVEAQDTLFLPVQSIDACAVIHHVPIHIDQRDPGGAKVLRDLHIAVIVVLFKAPVAGEGEDRRNGCRQVKVVCKEEIRQVSLSGPPALTCSSQVGGVHHLVGQVDLDALGGVLRAQGKLPHRNGVRAGHVIHFDRVCPADKVAEEEREGRGLHSAQDAIPRPGFHDDPVGGRALCVSGVDIRQTEGGMAEFLGDHAYINVLRVHAVFAHVDIPVRASGRPGCAGQFSRRILDGRGMRPDGEVTL